MLLPDARNYFLASSDSQALGCLSGCAGCLAAKLVWLRGRCYFSYEMRYKQCQEQRRAEVPRQQAGAHKRCLGQLDRWLAAFECGWNKR